MKVLVETDDLVAYKFKNSENEHMVGIEWKNGEHSRSDYRGFKIGGKKAHRVAKALRKMAKFLDQESI